MVTELLTGDGRRATGGAARRHLNAWKGYTGVMQYLFVLLLAVVLLPARGTAQSSSQAKEKDAPVPKAYLPPAGMCRIWVDNVPPARQPAPTSCATAIRNKPPNARVVFPLGKDGKAAEPKSLAPAQRPDTTRKRKPPN